MNDLKVRNQRRIKDYIEDSVNKCRLAVLATESSGQPHASLVAITPFENYSKLIFATHRNTLKYRNITKNNRVAVLIENEYSAVEGFNIRSVLTVIGHTEEAEKSEKGKAYKAHLKRHPEMEAFMKSPDCALIIVIAANFQIVNGIDDINWVTAGDIAIP
jgi:general stress protein 26